jgi:hypothetical protein
MLEPRPSRSGAPARLPPLREIANHGLHLAAASAFAFAQPLLSMLGKYPAFFAAHEASRWDVIGFALAVVLGPPLLALALELAIGLIVPALREPVHLVLMAGLVSLFALQGVRHADGWPTWAVLALALAIGIAVTALYATEHWARSIASVLGAFPVLLLVLFLFFWPTSKITLAGSAKAYSAFGGKRPPIIFVQLDAFPTGLLMDPARRIDAVRYPNLARLAGTGTWYRNATTAHDNTPYSIPSILDGRWPRRGAQPILADHPNNLFTLLGHTYQMQVYQSVTNLCPPGLCTQVGRRTWRGRMHLLADDVSVVYRHLILPKRLEERLPRIDDRWQGFGQADKTGPTSARSAGAVLRELAGGGRAGVFLDMVRRMRPGSQPLLSYMHILLPHEPRQYLPDGREYQPGADPDPSLDGWPSFQNAFLSDQALQRALLQVGFTDRLIGIMIDHLKRVGLWDKAMVIVTADHGESFKRATRPVPELLPGRLSWRRAVSPSNVQDIAPVPLLIKYPHERTGRIDDRFVKTIDVLPTIAATLGIRLPFHVDGRSLRDPAYRGRRDVVVERSGGAPVRIDIPTLQARRAAELRRRLALFGWGNRGPGLYGIGPHPELRGKPVSEFRVVAGGPLHARIQAAGSFDEVDLRRSPLVPSQITGWIEGGPPGGREIAVAVNGRIGATGVTFPPIGRKGRNLSVLVPDRLFRSGANRVALFEIEGAGAGLRLRRLATAG